jgi:hypothetical protein
MCHACGHRELRQSLVDMEDFLTIVKRKPAIEDGTEPLLVITPSHTVGALAPERVSTSGRGAASLEALPGAPSNGSSTQGDAVKVEASSSGGEDGHKEWPARVQVQTGLQARAQGLALMLDDVSFSYTAERPVRAAFGASFLCPVCEYRLRRKAMGELWL